MLYSFVPPRGVGEIGISAYDLDNTLVRGPHNSVKWRPTELCEKLREEYEAGLEVVIFTNQTGVTQGKMTEAEVRQKLEGVVAWLGVPVSWFAATGFGEKKPHLAMWNAYVKSLAEHGATPDPTFSTMTGDMAGRTSDRNANDRKFALNAGLVFLTPEEKLAGRTLASPWTPAYDPRTDPKLLQPPTGPNGDPYEIVLVVGPPCSGKSHILRTCFPNHARVQSVVVARNVGRRRCVEICTTAALKKWTLAFPNARKIWLETPAEVRAHLAGLINVDPKRLVRAKLSCAPPPDCEIVQFRPYFADEASETEYRRFT